MGYAEECTVDCGGSTFPPCERCENEACRALPFGERLERHGARASRMRWEAMERIGWTGGLDE